VISQALARIVDHRILMHICRSCKGEMECDDVRVTAFLLLRDCILFQAENAPTPAPAAATDASPARGEPDLRVELSLLCQDMFLSQDRSRDESCEKERFFSAASPGTTSAEINWSKSSGRRLWKLVGQTLLDLLLLLEPDTYWEHMSTVIAHAQLRNELSLLSEPCLTAQEMLRLRQPRRDTESSVHTLSPVSGFGGAAARLG
jgi:hypothetical protein